MANMLDFKNPSTALTAWGATNYIGVDMSQYKCCNTCNQILPVSSYNKRPGSLDGFRYACKSCESNRAKKWKKDNPEKFREYLSGRKVKANGNVIFSILPKDLKRLYNSCCVYCGSNENITQDHVIPISRGGHHSIGNLVPACLSCNSRKQKRFITEWLLVQKRGN